MLLVRPWERMLGRFAAIILLVACVALRAHAEAPADYIGAQACAGCHAAETKDWLTTHHAKAMQPATPAKVLGDFADARFEQDGVASIFSRAGDRFTVRTQGKDGAVADFDIAYTFGVYPLQQYLIALPGGRLQAFGIAWDSRAKEQGGQRWYSLYSGQALPPGDRLHWTGRDQTWNYMCADCHSTGLHKNFDLAADRYATSWTDPSVACEACHGPGSRHVEIAGDRHRAPHRAAGLHRTRYLRRLPCAAEGDCPEPRPRHAVPRCLPAGLSGARALLSRRPDRRRGVRIRFVPAKPHAP